MRQKVFSYVKYTDLLLLAPSLALCLISVLCLFSLGMYGELDYSGSLGSYKPAYTQLLAIALGLFCALAISLASYRRLLQLWPLHAAVCWGLVLLTFVPGVGYSPGNTGSQSWISMPMGMSFQPSEIAKISYILTLAGHLGQVHKSINRPRVFLPVLAHLLAPVVLLHFQGDDGTALMFLASGLFMLVMAGLNRWCVAACAAAGLAALPLAWKYVLTDYQRIRFLGLFYPGEYADGIMYQQLQAVSAIRQGRVWGTGLFRESTVYVPRAENDFIFSYVAEALGFWGGLLVLALLACLLLRLLYIAGRCARANGELAEPNPAGALICTGIFAFLFFQSTINIAMNLMLGPVIGVTLPFLSAGGTSILVSFMFIGLGLCVSRGCAAFPHHKGGLPHEQPGE